MEPDFYAPRDILIGFEKDLVEKTTYQSYIETVANMFVENRGGYVKPEALSQDALDVVNFEIELAKVVIEITVYWNFNFQIYLISKL